MLLADEQVMLLIKKCKVFSYILVKIRCVNNTTKKISVNKLPMETQPLSTVTPEKVSLGIEFLFFLHYYDGPIAKYYNWR